MNDPNAWIGAKINPYQIRAFIARGGVADVYLAFDTVLKREVCLKLLRTEFLDDAAAVSRFEREAQLMAQLDDPRILKIFDTGRTSDGQPYIVMEYIADGSLKWAMQTGKETGTWPFTPAAALRLVRDVALTLIEPHEKGIFHRDLKPANILLRDGTEPIVTDFGVALAQGRTRLTRTDEISPGTPFYMAPEQIEGKDVDGRSDIYALGIILFELLAGRHPFSHLDPWRIYNHQVEATPLPLPHAEPALAAATVRVVNTCLQKSPAQRYDSVQALAAALDDAIAAEGGAPETAVPRRKQLAIAGGAITMLALLLIVGISLIRSNQNATPTVGSSSLTSNAANLPATTVAPTPTLAETAVAIAVVIETPTLIPETAVPTETLMPPTPTVAPPTPTPTNTPIVLTLPTVPAATAAVPAVNETCNWSPSSRWNSFIDQYANQLGCASGPEVTLIREWAAYQHFPGGLMVWRQDQERAYVLFNNGRFQSFTVTDPNNSDPDLDDNIKGAFGYIWYSYPDVQSQMGIPTETEANASDFVSQDFASGVIVTYFESDFTYVLLNESSTWTAVQR